MRKFPRNSFILILFITFFALLINLPKEILINYETAKLPIINKKISIHQKFPGFNPNFTFGKFHFQQDFSFKKGLDLEGGTSVTLRADMKGIPATQRDNALESAKSVIERRVNLFGVSEPIVQTAKTNNDYRVIVEIPGVTDVNQAISLIGKTAKLSFWEEGASGSGKLKPEELPLGISQVLSIDANQTELSGSDLKEAGVTFDQNSGKPQVQLTFTGNGGKKFADITKRNQGKILAIVLDNVLVTAPRVNDVITTGNAVITGDYTTEQAKALQIQLNAGALPVSLSVLEQHAIGATLGQESLKKSLFAGLLGFLVIVLFMSVLYGRLGIIASFALVVYTLIILALFRLIPVTLTLAGIAGFILSIGIAVDANILIFERMREEMRLGKPRNVALELGFKRAWTSIRDSNISSLITSGILYYFGTGIIRGFALTLAIGVLVSMFSAIVVTRTFLRAFYRN